MIIDRNPEPNKDVKVHVLHKLTKRMSAGIGMWDGESWKLHTPLGYAPVPISLEVLWMGGEVMRRLLILLIERWQRRLYNQKDDLNVFEKAYKEIEKALFYGHRD